MPNSVKQILRTYIKQDKRIRHKLALALGFLASLKNPIDEIKKYIKEIHKPISLFKILILLHECLFGLFLDTSKAIQLLSQIKNQAKPKQNSQFDQLVVQKMINPYTLYLQKCYIAKSQGDYKLEYTQQNLFRIINILKQGLTIVDVLYIFGRYYQGKYEFIVDFNIILARDFEEIYCTIKRTLKKYQMLWNQKMKMEIEQIHEKMYIVYYNCYFFKQTKNFIPRWIDTDANSKTTQKKCRQKSLILSANQSRQIRSHTLNKSCNIDPISLHKSRAVLKSIQLNSTIGSSQATQTTKQSKQSKGRRLYQLQISSFNLKYPQYEQQSIAYENCQTVISQFDEEQKQNIEKIKQFQDNRLNLLKSFQRIVLFIDAHTNKIANNNQF